MKFRVNHEGQMAIVREDVLTKMTNAFPLSTAFIVDTPSIKETIKKKSLNFLKNSNFAMAPIPLVLGTATGGSGVFWEAFMTYIFPWMLDIAKVYCAIRIAQAFYQERRGGREDGTGFGALVTYGKWYLVFWLIPWGVELIDQIGGKMLNELRAGSGIG